MRLPVESETDAFRVAFLVGVSVAVGLVARLRAELDVPVTHNVVDRVHHHFEIVT